MSVVIGVSGAYRSGKDTVADYLRREYGFERIAMADPLKTEVKRIWRRTLEAYAAERNGGLPVGADEIDRIIYTDRTPVTRALLQEHGTELRRAEDTDYWVKAWARAVEGRPRVVTPDVRFPNETAAVRAAKGYLVRVERLGFDGDSHDSERALDQWVDWDVIFFNDGTIEDLYQRVEQWCRHIGLERHDREHPVLP
jgi:hypothetical protein